MTGGVWVIRQLKKDPSIDLFGKITIGDNVHIGINTIVMPGVSIGSNCIIGCGAVVTKNIPDGEVWAGVPARKINTVEEYYSKHLNEYEHTKQLSYEQKKQYLQNK